jgi:hypothetical protein
LNRQLASAVEYSVAAERFYIGGRAGFWRLVGFGLIAFGAGAALGIGFYGYSHVIQHSDNANVLLSAFSNALSDVHLQATAVGTVKVEPSEIALAKDQTISLDSSSRLLLDSKAKIVVEGEISVQAPTISSVQNSAAAIGPTAPTIVDFTVFKSVPFKEGSVLTGWKFLTSAQKFPSSQYCYYTEKSEASPLEPVVFIGTDERLTRPKHPPKDFDIDAAFTRCVWFNRELP